jgi:DNA-directed RNA polymerase specialized sigma24 family protein
MENMMKKSTRKGQLRGTSDIGAGTDAQTNCPPTLNKRVRRSLQQEIRDFDALVAREEAEHSGRGNTDVSAYGAWVFMHGGHEPVEANPDVLSDEEGINYLPSNEDSAHVRLLLEVRQLFTLKELQAWNLVMRHGMSLGEAADLLGISKSSTRNHVDRAKVKFKKFMEDKRNER